MINLPSLRGCGLLFLAFAVPGSLLAQTPLFPNGDFSEGMDGWNLLCLEKTPATAQLKVIENGRHAVCVTVPAAGAQGYYVQLVRRNISISVGKTYTLSFRARANPDANIALNLWPTESADAHALWHVDQVALTDAWKDYSFNIDPNGVSGTFNLDFGGLARQAGEYWFTDISLTEADK